MIDQDIPNLWATRFGLALTPLFEANEASVSGSHHVLLDGGYGSFALSVSEEQIWNDRIPADWSWSSNLQHHVTVTDREVAVVRWDKPTPELLTRSSVESQIDSFYAYLASDRVKSNQRVVDFMLTVFRRVRSLVANARIEDDRSTDAYLALLARAIGRSHAVDSQSDVHAVSHPDGEELLRRLPESAVGEILYDITNQQSSGLPVTLIPSLAVRHAGSEIFQEAHFELLRAPSPDLFGYVGPAESRQITRGGAHFTPPALARSIVEQTLAQLPDLANRERLAILDPACGSGAFLHEALRTLRRSDFKGKVTIFGRDTSRPSVSMARFVLKNAVADWTPPGGCEIEVEQGDSLTLHLPPSDLVLMNPPFVSWLALTPEQRQKMQDVLGHRLNGRGDFSMAFVTRALAALRPGGAMGTLLPGSLLTLKAADAWRRDVLDTVDLRFIASLGDYGLFTHAQVQIAAAVFAKKSLETERRDSVVALVTSNDSEVTGNALRTLRIAGHAQVDFSDGNSWHLFRTSAENLRHRVTWRLTSPRTETALNRLLESGRVVALSELFDVRQGVRTGLNSVFLLTTEQVEALPAREHKWFRPAIMNESIRNGQIVPGLLVFYPYTQQGLAITSEDQLVQALPHYFKKYLEPARNRLEQRTNIVQSKRQDWWGLSRRRSWGLKSKPRLLSKYFGGPGGFVTDFDARYIVVQGFAWFPKWEIPDEDSETRVENYNLPIKVLLATYAAIMNSRLFSRLLGVYSPHVAGGQFDLSPRYVNDIPIPNVQALATDERACHLIARLAELGSRPRLSDSDWRVNTNRLAIEIYGNKIFDQV